MTILIDSALSLVSALRQNPTMPCPEEILIRQRLVDVQYYSFDGKLHQGQIVVDEGLITDVKDVFVLLLQEKFPITSVIPIADPKFHWDDIASMVANNSSGFNYRMIANKNRISYHAYGRAIDINPKLNPFISAEGVASPPGTVYDPNRVGTIVQDSPIVQFFLSRGWEWGGIWTDRKDYQHFQKPK